MDFGELKDRVKPLIDVFDHSMIVSKSRYLKMQEEGHPDIAAGLYKHMPNNPTAENMVKFLFDLIKIKVPLLHKIRLHETETGWAEYKD